MVDRIHVAVAGYHELLGGWYKAHARPWRAGLVVFLRAADRADHRERSALASAPQALEPTNIERGGPHAHKMEVMGRLAGGVAHDLNNLLTVITGHTGFLLEDLPEQDPRRDDAVTIRNAAGSAADLTRQLLLFARKQAPERRVVDLNRKLSNVDGLLRRTLGSQIELVTVPSDDPVLVHADPGQIEQVIMNLALNARDAMPDGGKLVLQTTVAYSGSGERPAEAMLLVSDTGVGIDASARARIFEPCFTTKEHGKGTGFGLATVHAIVRETGGSITLDSEIGKGTSVRVWLPLVRGVRTAPLPEGDSHPHVRGSETVLVVEDQDEVRAVTARALRGYGYEVLVARSAREALCTVRAHRAGIDLVLSDLVMPAMHGHQLAAELRVLVPEIPIVFMTGFSEAIENDRPPGEDSLPLIHKPFRAVALASAIRHALDARPARDPLAQEPGSPPIRSG
jgi:signal transduction histidine kinase/CheY-like chemotaxis protein